MRRRNREMLTRVAATVVALGLPLLLAVQLVRAAGAPAEQLSRGLLGGRVLLAQAPGAAGGSASGASGLPLVTGVLYARGELTVDWNGVSIPVRDGSYAYVGGETVRVPPGSIGMLRVPGGGEVVLCPDSRTTLTRDAAQGFVLAIARGAARFRFPRSAAFSVDAGGTVVSPDPRAGAGDVHEGEVEVLGDGACLVCELRQGLRVARGEAAGPAPGPTVGRVIEVGPASDAGAPQMRSMPIPPPLLAVASGAAAASFLCRCDALRQAAQEAAEQAVLADAAAQESPPAAEAPPADPATIAPPVLPPDAPPMVVAEPGAPDPFDPNVLPPPAAGEPSSPLVVLPPPSVPFSGTGVASGGGGVTAAPDEGSGSTILPPVSDGGGGPIASPS